LRTVSPVASSSRRARSANAPVPVWVNIRCAVRGAQALAAGPHAEPRAAAIRRRADARGRVPRRCGCRRAAHGLAVEALGGLAIAAQRACACLDAELELASGEHVGVPRLAGRGHGPRTRGLARVFTGAASDTWCHGARHAHHLTTHPRTAPHPRVDPQAVLPRRPRRSSPHSARSSARVRRSHPRPSASAWLTELRTSHRMCRVPSHVSAIPVAKAPLCASRPRCSAPSSWRPTRGPASTAGRRGTSA
jgi:hypothetical protein